MTHSPGAAGLVFVTGIGGQDGTYLADRLVSEGTEVHALVRDDQRPDHVPGEVVLHTGDLADFEATRRLVLDLAPDEIYNLAAISSVAQSWQEPDLTASVNGTAAVALLETALQTQRHHDKPVRLVQASSAEVFGQPTVAPQDESTPIQPVSPYGAAKAFAHLAVGVWRHQDLHASSLILYNHESPRRPDKFVTRKITSTVAAIAQGRTDHLALGNLDARRDWGWAPDYVDAMIRAARADRPDDYVIATGRAHSVEDFVAAAFSAAGIEDWRRLVRQDPRFMRPADAHELVGDATRAHERLRWQPSIGFEEIVARMVEADLQSDD